MPLSLFKTPEVYKEHRVLNSNLKKGLKNLVGKLPYLNGLIIKRASGLKSGYLPRNTWLGSKKKVWLFYPESLPFSAPTVE